MNLPELQKAIADSNLDGWLFFDHHHRDPLSYRILGLSDSLHVTRRWYYFIPAHGEPRKLVHRIEAGHLDGLPGAKSAYSRWQEHTQGIADLLGPAKRIAMQYSPECAIFYVSLVDAGTIEIIRKLGVEVVSSVDLVQHFEARWNALQLESHLEAGRRVDRVRRQAFEQIGAKHRAKERIGEYEIQQFIAKRFTEEGLLYDSAAIVAVNENASNPHYSPDSQVNREIRKGDSVLIDMWAKLDQPDSTYYDITWMGFCGDNPDSERENIFTVLRDARNAGADRVRKAIEANEDLRGFHVDDAVRAHVDQAGYGQYFIHRTGHSIGTEVHGSGANMDNFELHDIRRVIPWTCFSIEPGIYMPHVGMRSEVNVFVEDATARVTGDQQDSLVLVV
ncbi:MAG TPA: M24 family metallopeptidase [Bryobacteraceae bacterium]|jgi:Xaa-Pro aminopeptidase